MVNEWENANALTLRKLVDVLRDIIKAAKEVNGPCVVSYKAMEQGRSQFPLVKYQACQRMCSLSSSSRRIWRSIPQWRGIKTEGSIKEEVTEDKDAIRA